MKTDAAGYVSLKTEGYYPSVSLPEIFLISSHEALCDARTAEFRGFGSRNPSETRPIPPSPQMQDAQWEEVGMSDLFKIAKIRTSDEAQHIQERSNAETEGFEPTPGELSDLYSAVLPCISADLDVSVVCAAGPDSM